MHSPLSASSPSTLQNSREDPDVLRLARERLESPDPYLREAGAQLLSGYASPEALRLLEIACSDRETRVIEGGLRALILSVSHKATEAEQLFLSLLQRSLTVRDLVRRGGWNTFGSLPVNSAEVRRAQFLSVNPDLALSRLGSLETGQYRRVQSLRSARLRHNPAFRALFDVIRSQPDLSDSLKPVLKRRDEFVFKEGAPRALEPFWGDIRRMTGLLAGLSADPALTALIEMTIDRTAARQTEAFWKALKSEPLSVPELVIGSGPHSANFCSTLAVLRPDLPPLVIERRERIGGQFAVPAGAAWRMNSRCRPASEDRLSRPGTGLAINSLGAYAPVQEEDLTGQSYASQDRIALATRLSLLLSAYLVAGTTFVRRLPNNNDTRRELGLEASVGLRGRYLVEVRRTETGESGWLITNALLHTGGLGEPNRAFGDRSSLDAIEAEEARARQGQRPRYLLFDDFMTRMAGQNPFPLREVESVIVIGAGDSARVATEALLGYGPERATGAHTLDRVRRVIWLGQASRNREQYLACERPRYHLLGVEFPREGEGPGASRIEPVASRAARFSITPEGRAWVLACDGGRFEADLVLDCTGYRRDGEGTPQPLARYAGRLRAGSRLRVCDALGADADVVITCQNVARDTPREGGETQVSLTGTAQQFFGRLPFSTLKEFTLPMGPERNVAARLEAAVSAALGFCETEALFFKASVLPPVYTIVNGRGIPIARESPGTGVFYLGPQAGLPLPEDARESAGKTPENTVALWRYATEVTAFAEYYFANRMQKATALTPSLPNLAPQELRRTRTLQAAGSVLALVPRARADALLAPGDSMLQLRYALSERLRSFCFPSRIEREEFLLTLRCNGGPKPETPYRLSVETMRPAIAGVSLQPLLEALVEDRLVQQVMAQWASRWRDPARQISGVQMKAEIARGHCRLRELEAGTDPDLLKGG